MSINWNTKILKISKKIADSIGKANLKNDAERDKRREEPVFQSR